MEEIEQSVGDGGANRESDVRVVQRLLLASGVQVAAPGFILDTTLPLTVSGQCDRSTIAHIEEFQRRDLNMRAGDEDYGLVTPTGATIFALNGLSGGDQPQRAPRAAPPRQRKAEGIRRVIYERRGRASESSASSGPFGAIAGVITDHLRGSGPVLASRHQTFPARYRINEVRIRRSIHRSSNLGSILTQTTTEAWFTWGEPRERISLTQERVHTGPVDGPDSITRGQIPRDQLDGVLPRGQ